MKLSLAAAVALVLGAALAPAVQAQQVLYQTSFETGLAGWTATGLWNLETTSDPCGATFAPFPEGSQCAWYGIDGVCTYDTPGASNAGSLVLNNWIDLPAGASSLSLRYWASSKTEDCGEGYDSMVVRVEAQNGPDAGFSAPYCAYAPGIAILDAAWHERRIDLSAYRGARVRFAFDFVTVDEFNNGFRGWLIDDVRVLAEPGQRVCPPTTFGSACPCQPNWLPIAGGCRNSAEQSATLYSEGAPDLSADTLRFRAVLMPSATIALLAQGTVTTTPAVFGDGLRCIGGTLLRLGTAGATGGVADWPSPTGLPISVGGQVPGAGATRYYFAYYRDGGAYCTAAQFNATDAQRIDWLP